MFRDTPVRRVRMRRVGQDLRIRGPHEPPEDVWPLPLPLVTPLLDEDVTPLDEPAVEPVLVSVEALDDESSLLDAVPVELLDVVACSMAIHVPIDAMPVKPVPASASAAVQRRTALLPVSLTPMRRRSATALSASDAAPMSDPCAA